MDVSLEGEWLELQVGLKKETKTLKLKIRPIDSKEKFKFRELMKSIELRAAGKSKKEPADKAAEQEKQLEQVVEAISSLILDWDLNFKGEKLPCTEEHKKTYLPYLIEAPVKLEKDEQIDIEIEGKMLKLPISFVGFEIIKFAQDFSNFLKN